MFGRHCFKVLGLLCLVLPFTGCNNTQVSLIQISPQSQSLAAGQTVQFTATGTVLHGSHSATSENVTTIVTWTSSTPTVATVNSSGLATAVAAGTTTITASMPGAVSATATITVAASGGGITAGGTIVSMTIIPGSQTVASPGQTSQFIAIATTSSGATEDVTGLVAWSSSTTQVATISGGGLATALGQGTTTIAAIAANADGTVVTGTATFTVNGGTSEPLTALSITPSSQSVSASETGQFIALGTAGSTGLEENVTSSASLQWNSSIPAIATVSPSGLVTGVSAGESTITALWTNPDASVVSATATVTVTSTPAPEPLLSLVIVPINITVGNLQDTGNFLAIGTYSTAPQVRDLTNTVTWISTAPESFPVDTNNGGSQGAAAGTVTAYGNGGAVIVAEATDPTTGSIQTATATFDCPLVLPDPPVTAGSCFEGSQANGLLVTLTVYNEGLNTTNWLVTAPSATGTQDVLHCGPGWAADGKAGGSVCTATYPLGTTVILTAPAQAGVAFGGWSYNCTPTAAATAAGPNSCSVQLGTASSSNVTVGAIFN